MFVIPPSLCLSFPLLPTLVISVVDCIGCFHGHAHFPCWCPWLSFALAFVVLGVVLALGSNGPGVYVRFITGIGSSGGSGVGILCVPVHLISTPHKHRGLTVAVGGSVVVVVPHQ